MFRSILRHAVLALAVSLCASAAHAETSASYNNLSSAALENLRNFLHLPYAPTLKPQILFQVVCDDPAVTGFRITAITSIGVRQVSGDRIGNVSTISMEVDAPGDVKASVEVLKTTAVVEIKQ